MSDRHRFNRERAEEEYQYRLEQLPARLQRVKQTGSYHYPEGDGFAIAALAHALRNDQVGALYGLRLALGASLAKLKLVQHHGQPVQVVMEQERYFIMSDRTEEDLVNAEDWLSALDLALILRDHQALAYLLQFPEEKIAPQSAMSELYHIHLFRFWRALFSRDPQASQWLLAAYRATDPEAVQATETYKLLLIDVPHLDVLSSLLSGQAEEMNGRLQEAIQKHRAYCERDNPDYHPFLISVRLSALAALAADNGYEVTPRSDYLPPYFVRLPEGAERVTF